MRDALSQIRQMAVAAAIAASALLTGELRAAAEDQAQQIVCQFDGASAGWEKRVYDEDGKPQTSDLAVRRHARNRGPGDRRCSAVRRKLSSS